jgi:hypothetical protein
MAVGKLTKAQIADIIDRFLTKSDEPWDWDDFISVRQHDPDIEGIRRFCAEIREKFPPDRRGEYTGEKGRRLLRELATKLRLG